MKDKEGYHLLAANTGHVPIRADVAISTETAGWRTEMN